MNLSDKNSIVEALKAGRVKTLSVNPRSTGDKRIDEIVTLAKESGVQVTLAALGDKRRGHGHGAQTSPPLSAFCDPFEYVDLENIRKKATAAGKAALVIALDHIQDPRNLGAILRSAAAAGAHGVIIEKKRCCDVTDIAYETSCGGADRVEVCKVANLRTTLQIMKEWGLWIAGADERAGENCWTRDLNSPLALVLGSEGDGLSRIVRDECDFLVKIPTDPEFPSLNASTAAGVLIFEASRQKRHGK